MRENLHNRKNTSLHAIDSLPTDTVRFLTMMICTIQFARHTYNQRKLVVNVRCIKILCITYASIR